MKAPAKGLPRKTVGSVCILIELADSLKQAFSYGSKYDELVFDISTILLNKYGAGMDEETFMTQVWGVMVSDLGMIISMSAPLYLSESLQKGIFNCMTSSFLVFDVAKELGMRIEMVFVPEHVFVKTENFFFETTSGHYHPLNEIHDRYPTIYAMTADPAKIQSGAYDSRGIVDRGRDKPQQALDDFSKEIELNPQEAGGYSNRGTVYHELGDFQRAILDYNKAIDLNSQFADAYYNRAATYRRLGMEKESKADMNMYVSLKSSKPPPTNPVKSAPANQLTPAKPLTLPDSGW